MNEDKILLGQVEHIRGILWQKHFITVKQFMIATVKHSEWWLQQIHRLQYSYILDKPFELFLNWNLYLLWSSSKNKFGFSRVRRWGLSFPFLVLWYHRCYYIGPTRHVQHTLDSFEHPEQISKGDNTPLRTIYEVQSDKISLEKSLPFPFLICRVLLKLMQTTR